MKAITSWLKTRALTRNLRAFDDLMARVIRSGQELADYAHRQYRSTPDRDWYGTELAEASDKSRAITLMLNVPKRPDGFIFASEGDYQNALKMARDVAGSIAQAHGSAEKFHFRNSSRTSRFADPTTSEYVKLLLKDIDLARDLARDLGHALVDLYSPGSEEPTLPSPSLRQPTADQPADADIARELFQRGAKAVLNMDCSACGHVWEIGLTKSGTPTKVTCPQCGLEKTIAVDF